jgi:transposase-like protein
MEIPLDVQKTLAQLRETFPEEPSCEAYLFERRWPKGFVCPRCGYGNCAALTSRAQTYECSRCRQQTSITSGTIMHGSKHSLLVWFSAAGLIASHPDRISVRLFGVVFGISRQSARLLRKKFGRLLVAFESEPLEGPVEIDHAEIQLRAADGSLNNSESGKVTVAVARERNSGHIRIAQLPDGSTGSIEAFVRRNVKPGEMLMTNGQSSYLGLIEYRHHPEKQGMRLILTYASNWLRRAHGLRSEEVENRLRDFVVNRSRHFRPRRPSFDTLIRLALAQKPTGYWGMVGRENPRRGVPTVRRNPRRRRTAYGMRQDGSGSTELTPTRGH